MDALGGERGTDGALEALGLVLLEFADGGAHGREELGGLEAVELRGREAVLDATVQHTDAFLHELVEVVGEDAEEADAFEKGRAFVLGELEDAPVELEPGEVAIQEARGVEDVGAV